MIAPHLILGGPGTGKTTRLLDIVSQHIQEGVHPAQIAFVTFTKAAATQARARASSQFNLTDPDTELPWFRTIHSLAYAQLGVQRDEVMGPRDWKEFSELVNEPLTGTFEASEGEPRIIGDMMLRLVDYADATQRTLADVWNELDEPVEWQRLVRFAATLEAYKRDSDKLTFTDMLLRYLSDGNAVPVRIAVIDEAQDLTASQWAVVRRAFENVEQLYIGGDDDQAIYQWAGADVAQFLALSPTPEVLPHSHRLSPSVHRLAACLAGQIRARYAKPFRPNDHSGEVHWHQYPSAVDLSRPGSWYLLARNNYMLRQLEAVVREYGVNYVRDRKPAVDPGHVATMKLWEKLRKRRGVDMITAKEVRALMTLLGRPIPQLKELTKYDARSDLGLPLGMFERPWFEVMVGIPVPMKDYYLACLRRRESLTEAPRITIETIHGVKGLEADHVLLMTDLSGRTERAYQRAPDAEHRVFYVGVTRARQSLHVVLPQTDRAYQMPEVVDL